MRQLALLACLLGALPASAQEGTPAPLPGPEKARASTSRDFVRMAFNFYDQTDGGGNPNLEEDMTVLEPMFLVSKSFGEKWTGTFKFQSDVITAASVDHDNRFPAGYQSGASGDKYAGGDVSAFYAWSDQVGLGFGITLSNEYDYQSRGAYGRIVWDSPSRNDTIVVKASWYHDTLDLIRFTGLSEGNDVRTSISPGIGWTHVIGPRTVGSFNYDLTLQDGWLQTPYNSVKVAGTEVTEELPDSRIRHNMFAKIRHLISENLAVEPGLGFYLDDWGATAINVELRAFWELLPGALILEPKYRFHTQTAVDDFVDEGGTVVPTLRTQDSDLDAFSSHTFGLMAVILKAPFLREGMEFDIGFDVTMRSDGLDAFSVITGYLWRF